MKTAQNPTNRDQQQQNRSPAKKTGEDVRAAEKVAAANQRLEDEDTGPMTPPELFDKKSRAAETSGLSSELQANRSPKQENL